MSVRVEEPDHAFRLLERLDQAIEQNPIETPITEADVILMMLGERVPGRYLLRGEIPGANAMDASAGRLPRPRLARDRSRSVSIQERGSIRISISFIEARKSPWPLTVDESGAGPRAPEQSCH